jgi:hypothetical protein
VNPGVIRAWLVALMALTLSGLPTRVLAACKIGRLAELPVTMTGLRPLVSAKINGADALFLADSGAFFSMITPAAAAEFKLKLGPAPYGLVLTGVGGEARAWLTTVKTFTLADIPMANVEFIVGGNGLEGAAGVLGRVPAVFRPGHRLGYPAVATSATSPRLVRPRPRLGQGAKRIDHRG